jgi:hypothetical protein
MTQEEQERRERIATMVRRFQEATDGMSLHDALTAIANCVALMAVSSADPESCILMAQGHLIEVYAAMRERVRSGKPPEVMN